MKKQLLYLTCIENILYSGVLRSQVIDLLKKIHEQDPDFSISLLSIVPIYNYFRYFKRKKILIQELQQAGIEFKIKPIFFLTRFFYMKRWQIVLFLIQALPILAIHVWQRKAVIVHARSYPAALVACLLRRNFKFQLIFDMKGLYPAEGQHLNRFFSGDTRKWIAIEKWLLKQADRIIGVSPEFLDYITPQFTKKYSTIPCCVDSALFVRDVKNRDELRKQHNLESRSIFVFSGSIGVWEQIQSLVQLFENIKKNFPTAFLLILTQTQPDKIGAIFEKIGSGNYSILHLPPEKVPAFLMAADFALLVRQKHLINKVSLTVKFGEYLAAGLPVIVTASTGEAARLVTTYDCGAVIEDENDIKIAQKIQQIQSDYDKIQQNDIKLITEYLDFNICANKYRNIYYQLLGR